MSIGLLVATSREPYVHFHGPSREILCRMPPGGVHSALDLVLSRRNGAWVAWGSGSADREVSDRLGIVKVPPRLPKYRLRRIWLTKGEVENFYYGYSNQVLWPFLHSMPSKVRFRRRFWEGYRRVNQRFATTIQEEATRFKKALIWVHDYQLALVPSFLRAMNPSAQIAHFWHIPWPGRDIFRTLPQGRAVLNSLLAADWIGFHLKEYADNFFRCAEMELGAKCSRKKGTVDWMGRRTFVRAFPISVDVKGFERAAGSPNYEKQLARLRSKYKIRGENYGIGVERMDYSKGILERLDAIRIFFRRYPEYRGRFTFLQIATTSREGVPTYLEHRARVRQEVKRIHRLYGSRTWSPVCLVEHNMSHDDLAVLYRGARLALVTSLRDGMNLVAKEFVASQLDRDGVLILSRFAGASQELKKALLVNPFDVEEITSAMRRAFRMQPEERRERLAIMQEQVAESDVYAWADAVLEDIRQTGARRKR